MKFNLSGTQAVLILVVVFLLGYIPGSVKAHRASVGAVESALRAAKAREQLQDAVKLVGKVAVERDSIRRSADAERVQRVANTRRATTTLAAIGPAPAARPDTCLEWITRADSLESATQASLVALEHAEQESTLLRRELQVADSVNSVLVNVIADADAVLEERATPSTVSTGFLKRLAGALSPVAQAGYGVFGHVEPGGKTSLAHGAYFSIGWEIQVSLASLFR